MTDPDEMNRLNLPARAEVSVSLENQAAGTGPQISTHPSGRSGARFLAWIPVVGALCVVLLMRFLDLTVDDSQQKCVHAALACCAICLVAFWQKLSARLRRSVLLGLTILAFANVFRFTESRLSHIDRHDVTCYYLGGKYASELGPFDLYPAVVAVDRANRRWADMRAEYWAQSLNGFERKRLSHALKRGSEVREHSFAPERWESFERDVLALQQTMERRQFRHFLVDKGFNATPAWIAYAQPLLEQVPVNHLGWLTHIDAFLLVSAGLALAFTFGADVALFSLLFFCVTISTKWLLPGSVILRYDWLAALVFALCALKRGRYGWAGAFAAVAGLVRIFPVVWVFGPCARWLATLWRAPSGQKWSQTRGLATLLIAFGVTLSVLELAAVSTVGTEITRSHWVKMQDHTSPEMISSKRPGFALALVYDGEFKRHQLSKQARRRLRDSAPLRYALSGATLVLLGFALRKRPNVEAFAYGYIPFFMLATGTYYYHVARLTLVAVHSSDLSKWQSRVALSFLLLLEALSQLTFVYFPGQQLFWTGWLSVGLTVYSWGVIGWLLYEDGRAAEPDAITAARA